jgi:hypothetical protein
MTKKVKIDIIISCFIGMVFLGGLYYKEYYLINDHSEICAKFTRVYKGRSWWNYEFEFKINDSIFKGVRSGSNIKLKDQQKLKSLDCIRIIYSKSDPTNIRIIDKYVGNEKW